MEKISKKRAFLNGFFVENPLFVLLLGTCPSLATTTSIESAIGMGVLFLIVLVCSNVLISLCRKIIPDEIHIPCYIVIIATFVTAVKLLTEAFLPELYSTLGVFISLIVVNCIVLGRAEAFASKNNVIDSLLDGVGMGLGYTMALIIIAFFREFLGTGGFTFGKVFTFIPLVEFLPLKAYAIRFFVLPGGAFLVLGIILAVIAGYKNSKEAYKKSVIKKEKELAKLNASKEANK